MYDNLYHLHIPKTGGSWINYNLIEPIRIPLEEKEISVRIDHGCWTNITDTTYLISSMRDPAKRTVSHFAFSVKYFGEIPDEEKEESKSRPDDWVLEKYTETTVDNFIKWVEEHETYISNFQSKFLLYENNEIPTKLGFYRSDPNFANLPISKEKLNSNINRINLLLRDTQLLMNSLNGFQKNILSYFGFDTEKLSFNVDSLDARVNVNDLSETLWNQLSDSQIKYLYELNSIDSDLYFTDSLYWNNGA